MSTWLDMEQLYLSQKDEGTVPRLLPLVRIGSSPQTAKEMHVIFDRLEKDGIRYVSYHFIDQPELKGQFEDALDEEAVDSLKFGTTRNAFCPR